LLPLLLISTLLAGAPVELRVLPAERRLMTDPVTGAELTFLTTHPAHDQSLYYEQRSWLSDSSLVLFNSSRPDGGLMGYLTATGELVRLNTPSGGLGGPTAARNRPSVFAMRGQEVIELALEIHPGAPSRVLGRERIIARIPGEWGSPNTALTESCDGVLLAVGVGGRGAGQPGLDGRVAIIEIATGKVWEAARVPGAEFGGHVVFSRTEPTLVSFGKAGVWISVVDARTRARVFEHKQVPGEFATHHCWWRDFTITFCGGWHPQPKEDADVKVMDIRDGTVRILGKGSWWPEASSAQLARWNWWHAAGHENGRWVAADNWHGDIGIFHGKTTRTYILTRDHRTYGRGAHPEVGWDRRGEQVVFCSHKLGNPDVCVAAIPAQWQREWDSQISH
jgi:oligogalacturonide lyase